MTSAAQIQPGGGARDWLAAARPYLLMVLPFLIGCFALNGLSKQFSSTGASDEYTYHYLTIHRYLVTDGPLELIYYDSATPPLYHLIMYGAASIFGRHIETLRFINMLFSIGTVFVFYRLLVDRLKYTESTATVLALVFAVSPYVLGQSFILMTDNLALLFGLSAIYCALSLRQDATAKRIFLAAIFIMLASLTRQTFVWLVPFASLCLIYSNASSRVKSLGISAFIAALIPLALLFTAWGGLVPPKFATIHQSSSFLSVAAIMFLLTMIAVYSLVAAPKMWNLKSISPVYASIALLGLTVASVLAPIQTDGMSGDGYLWFVAENLPRLYGVSLPLLFFSALGLLFLIAATRAPEFDPAPYWIIVLACLASLANRVVHQRYLDPIAFIPIAMIAASWPELRRRATAGVFVLLFGFLAYSVTRFFVS